jgi:trigger factor
MHKHMALTTEVTPLEKNRVQLDVAVPEEEVRQRIQRTIRQLGREVRVPGFRPGKAPPEVVVQRLGMDTVVQEMLKSALGDWYAAAVEESGVQPIDDPDLDLEDVPEEGDLTFRATVQTRPTAQLGDWKGQEVGRADIEIPEGTVEAQVEALRTRAARLEPVERAAETGDSLVIDFDGTIDGRKLRSATARDYVVELGGGTLVPAFEQALTGRSAGESVTFPVTYADDDGRDELRGRTVDYTVTVKAVQQKVVPEMTDDLALEVSGLDTVAELHEDIAGRVREAAEARADELFRRMAIDAVVAKATVDVPDVMVDRRIATILRETAGRLPEGVTLEQYVTAGGRTIDDVVAELRPDAEMAVRRELVVEAVAESEGITVTDEEVEEQVRADAEATGRPADRLLKELHKVGGFEALREDMRLRRAVDAIVENTTAIPMEIAEAREKIWTPENAGTPVAPPTPAGPRRGAAGPPPAEPGKLWTPGQPR